MKTLISSILIFAFCSSLIAKDIQGYYKILDDKTGKKECLVAVYKYQKDYYARIVGIYNSQGQILDSIYNPKKRAPGVDGHPAYCSMDILWDLRPRGSHFKGKVVDPERGGIYKAEVWNDEKGDLIVQGKLLFFSRSTKWPALQDSDVPEGFIKPDLTKIVPFTPEMEYE